MVENQEKSTKRSENFLPISSLVPFYLNPFPLLEGDALDGLMSSIQTNGVLTPITVRKYKDEEDKYEIIEGHNRFNICKQLGLEKIPAEILELTDGEAMVRVVETNVQRDIKSTMKHSERARIVTVHHKGLKEQGKRKDLEDKTSAQIVQKSDTTDIREKIAKMQGLNRRLVEQYLRIDMLSDELKSRLDNKEFGIAPAVEISFMKRELDLINKVLSDKKYKLNIKNAKKLRATSELSNTDSLTEEEIRSILADEKQESKEEPNLSVAVKKIGIREATYNEFLKLYNDPKKVMEKIEKALEEYLDKNTPCR
jgi:ParB family chromosome partitioning protein